MGTDCEENRCGKQKGKMCELCGETATIHCNADEAELCWSCDAKVHSANYLVARHMRHVLCKHCSAQTECQTSGPSPCPLCRSCAACEPAHVQEAVEVDLKGPASILSECNDDSEGLPPPAAMWLKRGGLAHCGCAESLNDAGSGIEDEKAGRKHLSGKERKERPKKSNKRPFASADKEAGSKISRQRRSPSPVSVIPVESSMCCNGSYSDNSRAL